MQMNSEIREKLAVRLETLPESVHGEGLLKAADGCMCPLGVLTELAVEAGVVSWTPKAISADNNPAGGGFAVIAPGETVPTNFEPGGISDPRQFLHPVVAVWAEIDSDNLQDPYVDGYIELLDGRHRVEEMSITDLNDGELWLDYGFDESIKLTFLQWAELIRSDGVEAG